MNGRAVFPRLRRWVAFSLCLVLAACSVSEPRAGLGVINGPDGQTLDPALATGLEDLRVINGLFEGLTRYDPVTARPIPCWRQIGKSPPMAASIPFTCANRFFGPRPADHRGRRGLFLAACAGPANRLRIRRAAFLLDKCRGV